MSKIVKIKVTSVLLTVLVLILSAGFGASAKNKSVVIGGEPFGLKLYCRGVMITGFESDEQCPAKNCGLRINDIITRVNGKEIKTVEEMENAILKSKGKEIKLEVSRDNSTVKVSVTPKAKDNHYIIGAWIKDSCAGIGTVSFYSRDSKMYAALGHGICDSETGGLIRNSYGEILNAKITSVSKSQNNSIGSLNGYFTGDSIGTITNNTNIGIYGETNNIPISKESFEVASPYEVSAGDAVLYTTVSSDKPQKYSVRIEKICNNYKDSNKNFIVKVTDSKLIEQTGGIVQGMSGSPIVQNGKLAGVLTHVFLEDCTCGYGIFAENMLNSC